MSKFSVYLSLLFLASITASFFLSYLPEKLLYVYLGLSAISFLAYAIDKSKAQQGTWRTKERTLHLLALLGGWPGAALAQQYLRHKSSKKAFRNVFWFTVFTNLSALGWLYSPAGSHYLKLLNSL